MVEIKEALAALAEIVTYDMQSTTHVATVRAFLQSVAQEREDRAAVHAWLDADDERYQSNGRHCVRGHYYLTLYPDHFSNVRHSFFGATRAEALRKAATWCRAEMAK